MRRGRQSSVLPSSLNIVATRGIFPENRDDHTHRYFGDEKHSRGDLLAATNSAKS